MRDYLMSNPSALGDTVSITAAKRAKGSHCNRFLRFMEGELGRPWGHSAAPGPRARKGKPREKETRGNKYRSHTCMNEQMFISLYEL